MALPSGFSPFVEFVEDFQQWRWIGKTARLTSYLLDGCVLCPECLDSNQWFLSGPTQDTEKDLSALCQLWLDSKDFVVKVVQIFSFSLKYCYDFHIFTLYNTVSLFLLFVFFLYRQRMKTCWSLRPPLPNCEPLNMLLYFVLGFFCSVKITVHCLYYCSSTDYVVRPSTGDEKQVFQVQVCAAVFAPFHTWSRRKLSKFDVLCIRSSSDITSLTKPLPSGCTASSPWWGQLKACLTRKCP